jgi:hypothetical protein
MRLITAHKILIASAIAFFAFFTIFEVRQDALLTAALSAAGTVGLIVYYRRRFR